MSSCVVMSSLELSPTSSLKLRTQLVRIAMYGVVQVQIEPDTAANVFV